MKKFIFILFLFLPINVFAISASSYVVVDQNTNEVLMGSNIHDEKLIASITKIMTAIIVIENSDLDEIVTVDESVLKAYGSAIYIEVGEKITIRDLLYGLMLRSGNDAAIVLANEVAGSMSEFADLMNDLVKELKLSNTVFYNNHGLETSEGENISTAYDMAVITSYAMNDSEFRKITSTENITVKTSYKTYSWSNKNKLLGQYDYITGGKTGYTTKASRTLVTTASKDGMDIVVVTLNDGNDWADHITLYEKVFEEYFSFEVLNKDITSLNLEGKDYYIKNDYNILISKNDEPNIEVKYDIFTESVNGIYGEAKVYFNDELLHNEKLYLKEEEEKESLWNKIVRWFSSW